MYSSYNIPQNYGNMQRYSSPRYYSSQSMNSSGDRFFGGGFFAPFLLGGITGSLLTRPNYPIYTPGPPIYYYPPYRPRW